MDRPLIIPSIKQNSTLFAMTTTPLNQPSSVAEQESGLKPRYEVSGNRESYDIRVELPGVKKEGLEIRLDKSILTLRAKRSVGPLATWKPLHRELPNLDYLLRLKLNAPVDDAKLSAKLEDGVLILHLPLKEAAKPRRIEVQ